MPYSSVCRELALLKQGKKMKTLIGMNEKEIGKLAMDTFISLKRFGSNPETTYAHCVEMAIHHLYPLVSHLLYPQVSK
jgi:hypothetical protein